jgi:hypothetical protein
MAKLLDNNKEFICDVPAAVPVRVGSRKAADHSFTLPDGPLAGKLHVMYIDQKRGYLEEGGKWARVFVSGFKNTKTKDSSVCYVVLTLMPLDEAP